MKVLHTLILSLIVSVASVSTSYARDSVNIDIHVGGYGYAPQPVVTYYAPPVVYYVTPPVSYYDAGYYGKSLGYTYTPSNIYTNTPTVSYHYHGNRFGHEHRHHR
ncbi:MAG: hypothetical protein HOP21_08005 [Methylotenera sp.]|nr:hypothetical protein [Methylotenera sp.]